MRRKSTFQTRQPNDFVVMPNGWDNVCIRVTEGGIPLDGFVDAYRLS
jgi:hypothetical protein